YRRGSHSTGSRCWTAWQGNSTAHGCGDPRRHCDLYLFDNNVHPPPDFPVRQGGGYFEGGRVFRGARSPALWGLDGRFSNNSEVFHGLPCTISFYNRQPLESSKHLEE